MFLIAGPCVIESRDHCMFMAEELVKITHRLELDFIFKSSYDKANRTSGQAPRGVGWRKGRVILENIRHQFGCDTITDVHSVQEVLWLRDFATYLQVPAMLSRQTDLIMAAAAHGYINIKKSQGMSAHDMYHVVNKAKDHNQDCKVLVTERGSSFGYNNLIVDFRNLIELRNIGADAVVYDASHSVQQPGGANYKSSGQREMIAPLAAAAIAVGVDGIFIEVHDRPNEALCDGDIAYPLHELEELLKRLKDIDALRKSAGNNSGTQELSAVA